VNAEAYGKALAAFQASLPTIAKGHQAKAGSYDYSYADLTDVSAAVVPALAKHGLSWSARPTLTEAGFVLAYCLRHEGGHVESGEYPLPDPTKTPAQQLGSAITYARRYALCAMTGVAPGGDDDDGAKAQEARSSHSTRPARQQEPAGQSPVNAAKGRVWTAAQSLGWDRAGLADHYRTSTGAEIAAASVADLDSYSELLGAIAEDNAGAAA